MSLKIPTGHKKVNHQLNILKSGNRERRSSFAFFQDDIMKSRAMEFMPAELKDDSDKMSVMANDNRNARRDTLGSFMSISRRNINVPMKSGDYDTTDEAGKEVLEALNKKKAKVEKRIAHEKRIPEPS